MRIPADSNSSAAARSRASSRKLRSREAIRNSPRSGRICCTARIRENPPASTAWDTPCSRSSRSMRATCPTFTQSSRSTSEASAGSVSPTCPTATTPSPFARAARAKSRGSAPLPAMRPMRSTGLAGQPALAGGDEEEQRLDLALVAELRPQPLHRLLQRQLASEEDPVRLLHPSDLLLGVPVTGEPDAVDAHQLGPVALGGAERRHVHHHHRPAGDESVLPDAGELVHRRQAPEDDVVPHLDVPTEGRGVGQHAAVPHLAVVGHVRVGHEEVAVPDAGDSPAAGRSLVEGGELADEVLVPDLQGAVLARVLEVLGLCAHRGELEDLVPLAEAGAPLDDRVGPDRRPSADLHPGADDRVRPHLDGGMQLRSRGDDGRGMDAHRSLSTTVARNSPSATTSPSTFATPRVFMMAPLKRTTSTSSSRRSPGTVGLRNFAPSMAMR